MARKKRKTERAVARDTVTLSSVFTGIANAIREKTGGSSQITPINMGNAIRGIKGVSEASLPESSLPAVLQDIADAIRACGITGNMTAAQMPTNILSIVTGTKTKVKYTQTSGLQDWESQISGTISGSLSGNMPQPTTQIPNVNDIEEIEFGSTVTNIGDFAFFNCSSITGLTIPDNVTGIGEGAFAYCTSVTDVTIGNGVTSIGYGGFAYCHNITSITFGSSLSSIDSGAFSDTACTIFDFRNATSIPTLADVNAFGNTPANKKIVVPDSLYDSWKAATNWSSTTNGIVNAIIRQTDYESPVKTTTTFYFSNGTSTESEITGELTYNTLISLGLKSNYSTWTNCPTRVEIGSGVTGIGADSFKSGKALIEVTMADSVLTMGDRAFQDCDNLATVTLSNNLTQIGKECFKWDGLTGITVPSSVNSMGSNVFAVCNSLNSITFQGKTKAQVQGMTNYNFGLKSGCVVTCTNGTITI